MQQDKVMMAAVVIHQMVLHQLAVAVVALAQLAALELEHQQQQVALVVLVSHHRFLVHP